MSTLLQKEIKINRIVITNVEQAKALDDPARIKILQILYHKQFSADQLVEELHKTGYNKATTTIRHHLDVLKRAGLVEIVKMEEIRGAVMKFYGTSIKLLGYDTPANFDSDYSKIITDTSIAIQKIIKNIVQNNMSKTKKKNIDKRTKAEQNYDQYLLIEIVNRALTKVLENNSYDLIQKK
ncbi:MAG TPA: winged helix-turn-helix domain-containing protein [Nitrosopumilaceae archaeon]|nr:winged helix-turn-helix domain-containing protein [Nitrosopumilaceae archaeon]